MSVVKSHSLSIGIVGLPNAGKSTFFNSLTANQIEAANYPFTTIDKNVGVVEVPDARLAALSGFFDAQKIVPAAMKFVDIAGLVKGASQGEGLGNQFLSHIREVDVIMYVLRSFKSDTISHVYDRVSPKDDLEIVQSELIFKDIESVAKKFDEVSRRYRSEGSAELKLQHDVLKRLLDWLNEGRAAIDLPMNPEEAEFVSELWLLSYKKRIYVLNTREGTDESDRAEWVAQMKEYISEQDHSYLLQVDVKSLGDLRDMSEADKDEYFELLGERSAQITDVIKLTYERLGLITFYTGSKTECNAWSIQSGATAKEAAGVIHSDLADGFITAEIVDVEKLIELGGMAPAKEQGAVRAVGKDYIVKDGEYMIVHSN